MAEDEEFLGDEKQSKYDEILLFGWIPDSFPFTSGKTNVMGGFEPKY